MSRHLLNAGSSFQSITEKWIFVGWFVLIYFSILEKAVGPRPHARESGIVLWIMHGWLWIHKGFIIYHYRLWTNYISSKYIWWWLKFQSEIMIWRLKWAAGCWYILHAICINWLCNSMALKVSEKSFNITTGIFLFDNELD